MSTDAPGFDAIPDISEKIFNIITQNPFLGFIALAIAIVIVALPVMLAKFASSLTAKFFGFALLAMCYMIIGSGWFLIIFPNKQYINKATLEVRLSDNDSNAKKSGEWRSSASAHDGYVYDRFIQPKSNLYNWIHEVLVPGQPKRLFFSVFRRRMLECRTNAFDEFETPVSSSSEVGVANTDFEIELSQAYLKNSKFELEFVYKDNLPIDDVNDTRKTTDRLYLKHAEGIDISKLKVYATHTESLACTQDRLPNRYFEIEDSSKTTKRNPVFSFVQSAIASDANPQQQKDFAETLSGNITSSDRLSSFLSENPDQVETVSVGILSDDNVSDETKSSFLETLLTLSVSDRPKSDNFLHAFVPLIVHDNFDIRRNAARYLRAKGYADETVVQAVVNFIDSNEEDLAQKDVPERDYSALYLATAAGRDVFYNYGIRQIDEIYLNADTLTDQQVADRTSQALKTFDTGQALAKYAPEDRRVLFGKLDYGAALANYTAAALSWAHEQKAVATSSTVKEILDDARTKGATFPEGTAFVSDARSSFSDFLAKVEPLSDNYSWLHHIEQAKRCLATPGSELSVTCLAPEVAE